MKAANKHWRIRPTMHSFRDITDEGADKIDEQMKTAYSWVQKSGPYESFRLSNNNANIKRIEERLAKLRKLDEMPEQEIPFDGGTITVDLEENRVKIEFDVRQSDEITEKLKATGSNGHAIINVGNVCVLKTHSGRRKRFAGWRDV
ncbi:hypothetical protein FACS18949_16670 [Clostridia bacterium]|nr:hypothetical protein FACS18949_16670 [Clostridia bacterium]